MRIWIDFTNSPHVNFFAGMVSELQQDHDFVLTCRPLANTIELLKLNSFSYFVIGKHYGQYTAKKAFGFLIRVWQLYSFLKDKAIDVAISHSSFYSPLVARLLGIRSIYLNDNEYAAGNRVSFIFADQIFVPEFLGVDKVMNQWGKASKIIAYPGVKEGIYLWHYPRKIFGNCNTTGLRDRKVIFVRPEPWSAQYYKGKRNFIDSLLVELKDRCKVVLLPRSKEQQFYYSQKKFSGITIPEESYTLAEIMERCDLFIGAGGTMTREAAVLGIPTISIYQDNLLDVDKYLIRNGFMVHKLDPDATFVMDFLENAQKRAPDKQLVQKGKEGYELIKRALLHNNIAEGLS